MSFVRKITQKLAPPTCQLYLAGLVSYAKYLKVQENLDWQKINHLIPHHRQKFFTTINQQELTRLKLARFEQQEEIYQRNNLILDFLFYSGIRVSELTNIRHRDWENNSLHIRGKGNKVRYVFLPPFLGKYFKLGSVGYLFTSQANQKLTSAHIRHLIKRRVNLAKLNK
jgi:site-specific recombinase XerD